MFPSYPFNAIVRNGNYLVDAVCDLKDSSPINCKSYGATGDGVTDDTSALSSFLDDCRRLKQQGFIPAGSYKISSSLDVTNVNIQGAYMTQSSNYNSVTKIIGDGTFELLVQTNDNLPSRQKISSLYLNNGTIGLYVKGNVFSIYENIIVVNCDLGFQLCKSTDGGGLWNKMINCQTFSCSEALRMEGISNQNANYFESCYFRGTTRCIYINITGSLRGVANYFFNCEVVNDAAGGIGIEAYNIKNTTFENCYLECKSPLLKLSSTVPSLCTVFRDCVWGSLRNSSAPGSLNTTGVDAFIWHVSGDCSVEVYGGSIYMGSSGEQNDLRLFHSDDVNNLHITMLKEPDRYIFSTGFEIFDTGLPTNKLSAIFSHTYTPTITATGFDLGDASLSGRYNVVGNTCYVSVNLSWSAGTTLDLGTSDIQFSLPLSMNTSIDNFNLGDAVLYDYQGSKYYTGVVEADDTTNRMTVVFNNNGSGFKFNNPFSFNSAYDGFIRLNYSYELVPHTN